MKEKNTDTVIPGFPSFPSWKDWYDQAEAFWTRPLKTLLGSEIFNSLMAVNREGLLSQQRLGREFLEKYWDNLRLPTKTDHARLASQVVDLENKVEALGERWDGFEEQIRRVIEQQEAIRTLLEKQAKRDGNEKKA